jgi:thiol-disulfide isomerase/thioredoxin
MLIYRSNISQNSKITTRIVKTFLLLLCIPLSACKPLTEYDFIDRLFDRGTLLASGEYTPVNHWEGQWKIVNIWAEWCQPCWHEIPELNQFYKQQNEKTEGQKTEGQKTKKQKKERLKGSIQLLGLNFDQLEAKELAKLKKSMSIEFPVLTQWPEIWEKPEIKGLPASIIIGPNNTVRSVLLGPQTLKSLNEAMSQEMKNK